MTGANASLRLMSSRAVPSIAGLEEGEKPVQMILPRLFSFDSRSEKYVEHLLPCAVTGNISYVNAKQKVFAIQLNSSAAQGLIKDVHDYFSTKPMGQPFSAKPEICVPPPSFKVGKFAVAYIEELQHVCRVEILTVNKEKQEAEVLAIDVGAVALVPYCLLYALPDKFTQGEYRTALALVCRLAFREDSKFLTVKDLWFGLRMLVFVLSKTPPHMVLATEVGDNSFVDCLLLDLPEGHAIRLQQALNELNAWNVVNRYDHHRRMTYCSTPSPRKTVYVATVVGVTSITAIHIRDFESGVRLVMLTEVMRRRYSNTDFCKGMVLLEDEICPGLGVVFYQDNNFFRGAIRTRLTDGRVWVDCIDFPNTFHKVPLDVVFHPSYELLHVGALVWTVDLSEGLSPCQAATSGMIAARTLEPGMVVNVTHDGEHTYITLPNNHDLHVVLGLPRPAGEPSTVWTPEASMSRLKLSNRCDDNNSPSTPLAEAKIG
uniref:Tudor domain-containing protein n=2 Tax=Panagrellus redivivus TaxID=6233 RepID=A0A7E4W6F8_PANRE